MKFTVGITTHNRAQFLEQTLRDLLEQKPLPSGHDYELIVVDNLCADGTSEVLMKYQKLFGDRLRVFREENLGTSWGRNRIVRESRGDVIAYTDDDVVVDSSWLVSIARAYERWPDAWGIGGKTHLIFETPPPAWIGSQERSYLAEMNLGDRPVLISKDQVMFSLNLTLRKSVFEKTGFFRTDLGPMGQAPVGGEETDLLRKIHAADGRLYYDPEMLVGHRISSARLRKAWFFWRFYCHGKSLARRYSGGSFFQSLLKAVTNAGRIIYYGFRKGFSSDPVYQAGKSLAVESGKMAEKIAASFSPAKRTSG